MVFGLFSIALVAKRISILYLYRTYIVNNFTDGKCTVSSKKGFTKGRVGKKDKNL